MGRVVIAPATLRDVTYIGANLRPDDMAEISCQLPAGLTGSQMAATLFGGMLDGWAWVASCDGNPACVFGFAPYSAPVWTGFAFGTARMVRVIPAVTAHCIAQEQRLLDAGVRRVEVRSLKGHDTAQAWLARLGCRAVCDLPDAGRDGETFILWAWCLADGRPSTRIAYKDRSHVHSKATEAAGTAAAAPA